MKAILILILALAAAHSFSQAGYLGRKNAVEFDFNIGPATKRVYIPVDDIVKSRPRYAYTDFGFSFSRTVARHIELSAGYSLTLMRPDFTHFYDYDTVMTVQQEPAWFPNEYNLFDSQKCLGHSFKFEFKYFRRGSISPVGRYIGFGFLRSSAKIKKGTELDYGGYGEVIADGSLKRDYDLLEHKQSVLPRDMVAKTNIITMFLGQNYPLTARLVLSAQVTIPFLCFGGTDVLWTGTLFEASYGENSLGDGWGDYQNKVLGDQFYLYNQLKVDLGLKYHF